MSNKLAERVKELERQVRELQARPSIVINNPAPLVMPMPSVVGPPAVALPYWPTTTSEAASVGLLGYPPVVNVSH